MKIEHLNKEFVVCTNACNEGLGGVLTQEGHVIAYESINLKIHKNNYATYDLVGCYNTFFKNVASSSNR